MTGGWLSTATGTMAGACTQLEPALGSSAHSQARAHAVPEQGVLGELSPPLLKPRSAISKCAGTVGRSTKFGWFLL